MKRAIDCNHPNKFQELQDENARLHTIINTYHRDIEELRKKNIYLQSWLQSVQESMSKTSWATKHCSNCSTLHNELILKQKEYEDLLYVTRRLQDNQGKDLIHAQDGYGY